MSETIPAKIQVRRGTAAEWLAANPVLLAGEIGCETDTGILRVGDGVRAWNALPTLDDVIVTPTGGAANTLANHLKAAVIDGPAALTAHKASGDHDARYLRLLVGGQSVPNLYLLAPTPTLFFEETDQPENQRLVDVGMSNGVMVWTDRNDDGTARSTRARLDPVDVGLPNIRSIVRRGDGDERYEQRSLVFTSAEQTITLGGAFTLNHSLGGVPDADGLGVILRCVTAEHGYVANDIVVQPAGISATSSSVYGTNWKLSSTQLRIRIAPNGFALLRDTDSGYVAITPANWRVSFLARRSPRV